MRCGGGKEKSPKRMCHPSHTARGRKSAYVMGKPVKTCGSHPQMAKGADKDGARPAQIRGNGGGRSEN